MGSPFKYLGFWLKPNDYRKEDWSWLIANIEARISHWSFKWLSKVGRLTLIKSVLLSIPVYWAALTWVPKGVLEKIRRICSRFLWAGTKENSTLPWVAWEKVARPKDWGGWGIKSLPDFRFSLAAKSGWRLIKTENLWTRAVKRKYIDPTPLEDWIKNLIKTQKNVSAIWKATLESFKVVEQGLAWKIGNGEKVKIGKDPWVGCNGNYALSPDLVQHTEEKGLRFLSQVEKPGLSTIWGQAWKNGEELDLEQRWWIDWNAFTHELFRSNVRLSDRQDELIWAHADSGEYSPKNGYTFLMTMKEALKIWCETGILLNKKLVWEDNNIQEAWQKWWNEHPDGNLRNLPLIISWGIWIARNRSIFQDKDTPIALTAVQGAAIFSSIPRPKESSSQRNVPKVQISEGIPWAFFDGASQNNKAGAGLVIHESPSFSLKASVGLGTGSNNFAELLALKLLLCWLIQRHTLAIQIFGDSQNVIRWVNGQSTCSNQILKQILGEIQRLKSMFNSFSICHIYRERNDMADKLSKDGLQQDLGCWQIVEDDHGQISKSIQPPYQPI
eukprot:PITA_31398